MIWSCKHIHIFFPKHACRLLFWSSDGTVSSIYRASLNGSDVRNILRTTEKIKTISLDLVNIRLYWIQHDHGKEISHIGSCDYDGGAVYLLQSSGRWVFLSLSEIKRSFPWYPNKKKTFIFPFYSTMRSTKCSRNDM